MKNWKRFKQVSIVIMFVLNIIPITIGTIRISEGGQKWGGKMPSTIKLSFISMLVSGVLGFIVLGILFYQLVFNRKYIGSKAMIRGVLFVIFFYLASGIMGSISTNTYSSKDGTASCTYNKLQELWDSNVLEQGKQAYSNFCHVCKCHISHDIQNQFPNQNELLSLSYNSFFGPDNISQCDPREGQLPQNSTGNTFSLLKDMEKNYKCAGFCSNNLVFTFYGISQGVPTNQQGCFVQVTYEMFRYKLMFLVVTLSIGGLDIMIFFIARSLRIDRIKEIMIEHGIDPNLERFESLSIIGDSHEDWRAGDPYSSMGQQRSNTSNGNNIDDKSEPKRVEHLKLVKRAFRSMHNANPLLKK